MSRTDVLASQPLTSSVSTTAYTRHIHQKDIPSITYNPATSLWDLNGFSDYNDNNQMGWKTKHHYIYVPSEKLRKRTLNDTTEKVQIFLDDDDNLLKRHGIWAQIEKPDSPNTTYIIKLLHQIGEHSVRFFEIHAHNPNLFERYLKNFISYTSRKDVNVQQPPINPSFSVDQLNNRIRFEVATMKFRGNIRFHRSLLKNGSPPYYHFSTEDDLSPEDKRHCFPACSRVIFYLQRHCPDILRKIPMNKHLDFAELNSAQGYLQNDFEQLYKDIYADEYVEVPRILLSSQEVEDMYQDALREENDSEYDYPSDESEENDVYDWKESNALKE